ncbi:hypothetical protein [Nannocystis pusilla]|nr:hypothetical protein [Nannocystis pusilla]
MPRLFLHKEHAELMRALDDLSSGFESPEAVDAIVGSPFPD